MCELCEMLCEMFCSASSVSGDGVVNGVQVDGVAEHLLRHGGRSEFLLQVSEQISDTEPHHKLRVEVALQCIFYFGWRPDFRKWAIRGL